MLLRSCLGSWHFRSLYARQSRAAFSHISTKASSGHPTPPPPPSDISPLTIASSPTISKFRNTASLIAATSKPSPAASEPPEKKEANPDKGIRPSKNNIFITKAIRLHLVAVHTRKLQRNSGEKIGLHESVQFQKDFIKHARWSKNASNEYIDLLDRLTGNCHTPDTHQSLRWVFTHNGTAIEKRFRFKNSNFAYAFASAVMLLATHYNHHADMGILSREVLVRWETKHGTEGETPALCDKDVAMAERCENDSVKFGVLTKPLGGVRNRFHLDMIVENPPSTDLVRNVTDARKVPRVEPRRVESRLIRMDRPPGEEPTNIKDSAVPGIPKASTIEFSSAEIWGKPAIISDLVVAEVTGMPSIMPSEVESVLAHEGKSPSEGTITTNHDPDTAEDPETWQQARLEYLEKKVEAPKTQPVEPSSVQSSLFRNHKLPIHISSDQDP